MLNVLVRSSRLLPVSVKCGCPLPAALVIRAPHLGTGAQSEAQRQGERRAHAHPARQAVPVLQLSMFARVAYGGVYLQHGRRGPDKTGGELDHRAVEEVALLVVALPVRHGAARPYARRQATVELQAHAGLVDVWQAAQPLTLRGGQQADFGNRARQPARPCDTRGRAIPRCSVSTIRCSIAPDGPPPDQVRSRLSKAVAVCWPCWCRPPRMHGGRLFDAAGGSLTFINGSLRLARRFLQL